MIHEVQEAHVLPLASVRDQAEQAVLQKLADDWLRLRAVLLAAAALRRVPVAWPRWAKAVPAYGIGTMAAFWFLQRAVSLM